MNMHDNTSRSALSRFDAQQPPLVDGEGSNTDLDLADFLLEWEGFNFPPVTQARVSSILDGKRLLLPSVQSGSTSSLSDRKQFRVTSSRYPALRHRPAVPTDTEESALISLHSGEKRDALVLYPQEERRVTDRLVGSLHLPVAKQIINEAIVERLHGYFELTCDRSPRSTAVICGDTRLTYLELDRIANQLAHVLMARGVMSGTPVGILLERSIDAYVALLGVLKAGGAFVPLDSAFPTDRVAYIARDAGMWGIVTTSTFREQTGALPCAVLELDRVAHELKAQSERRPDVTVEPSSLCYVIYTSGTTGRPKGVAVSHASIVNFLRVVPDIYGVRSDDRVYQGMSSAFDFSFEEIWPTWIAGATLIAGPTICTVWGMGLPSS